MYEYIFNDKQFELLFFLILIIEKTDIATKQRFYPGLLYI